ncbi:MAG: metal ABC transporter ATP-binding protein [Cypionkella sp.]|nr:metal ABC transporter ATP-binding protein [Cypionkella sp.]
MVPPTPFPNAEALVVRGLTVRYDGRTALEGAEARVPVGTLTAIVGPNGAGKSTFLKGLLGLEPAEGEVRAFGQAVATALPRIAYVPQRAAVDWGFPVRVIDVVLMGAWRRMGLLGRLSPALRDEAREALDRVGMADLAARQIGALSGGQQQRVFIARALMQRAELYLLDEPFAGVDAATEAAIIAVLKGLRDKGATIIAVHHDLSTVGAYFDRVLLLNHRTIAEGPVATTFTREALAQTYGAGQLVAVPA